MVQAGLGKRRNPISKLTTGKRGEGVAHTVENLLSKYKAGSSNPIAHTEKELHLTSTTKMGNLA
jgi:hypothetical protein